MVYAMVVSFRVKEGRMDDALEVMAPVLRRAHDEDGCLSFEVAVTPETNTMFIYEAYVSKAYHDDVHESYPEVVGALALLPELVDGPMDIAAGDLLFSRASGDRPLVLLPGGA